jgi:hypothetical protein
MARGFYAYHMDAQAVSTAITILEVAAPATAVLRLIRAWCSQSNSTTSAMNTIEIVRKTATITGAATPPSVIPLDGSAASGVTQKWKATAEGTDGNIVYADAFNVLNGWLWLPVPEERIIVPPSGIIALKFPSAPASANYTAGLLWEEIS